MAFISNFEYLLQGEDLRHVDSLKLSHRYVHQYDSSLFAGENMSKPTMKT